MTRRLARRDPTTGVLPPQLMGLLNPAIGWAQEQYQRLSDPREYALGGWPSLEALQAHGKAPLSTDDMAAMALDMASPFAKVGGGLLGMTRRMKPPRMSKEEAIAAGYWHPIGDSKKLQRPFNEMTSETVPAMGILDPMRADLEAMQGGTLIPAPGDRSDVGKYLKNAI